MCALAGNAIVDRNTIYNYLNGPVPLARDLEPDAVASFVNGNSSFLGQYNRARHFTRLVLCGVYKREKVSRWDRQERTVQGFLQVAVIRADRVVDSYQLSTGWECTFYHEFRER